ncbi:serine/threonine protein kinase [Thalassoporum mexicanum PCC 7367]|uniref:serine/threonine protein kinase n=1 Tax=Thalassoporum mexicanum TaxID=3457544 RepID=UPI00029FF8E4|nr:serine/threonine-protein kinase [Pseudanabaena sp. PCC 7367]AFY70422.1 serine/threonine protein kinase [Pseudanabaena sp. PCC 7367]
MLQSAQVLKDRYQLEQPLGQNAGRQTWLAFDLEAEEQVVVKLLTFGGDVQWDDLKLFEREAQVLQQLDHPCIPKYRDYFSIDDRALWFGLVQDYIPGDSLKDLLMQGKKFSEAEVKQIAIEILEILIYLHELNPTVLHRDIKPSNIIYGADQKVYLVDFGAVQDKASAEGKTFTVVGTYGYAPIEQFGGRAVPASDLYALGATLIHLLTGISPAELPQDDMRIEFKDRTSCDRRLSSWIEALTEPSLKKRPENARAAIEALRSGRAIVRNDFKVEKPANSRIRLHQHQDNLIIKLPGPKKSSLEWIGTLFSLLALVFSCLVTGLISIVVLGTTFTGIFKGNAFVILFPLLFTIFGFLAIGCTIWLVEKIISDFGRERIMIDDTGGFIIKRHLFGFKRVKSQSNLPITSVHQGLALNRNHAPKSVIYLNTVIDRYSFAVGLTSAECMWLEQEIKEFLGLK